MKTIVSAAIIVMMITVSGCTTPTGEEKNDPTLILEYPAATIAVQSYFSSLIKGGTPPYTIKSISDSGMISGYMYFDRYSNRYRLEVNSKNMLGFASIEVQDSLGVTGTVRIKVVEFTTFPEAVEMKENSYLIIRIQGGTKPYRLEIVPDSVILHAECSSYLSLYSRKAGRTALTLVDSSPEKKRVTVTVTVLPRYSDQNGTMVMNSSIGERRFTGPLSFSPDNLHSSGASGIGWKEWSDQYEILYCYGLNILSDSTVQYLTVTINAQQQIITQGIYPINQNRYSPDGDPSSLSGSVSYFDMGPGGMTIVQYVLTKGQIQVSSKTGERIAGIFSGEGFEMKQPFMPDSARPFYITNGSFDIPYSTEIIHNGAVARTQIHNELISIFRKRLTVLKDGY